ncbi:MAG TPA: FAD-dependent oxidoreductase [Nocardioidaceae bacterium]|nr:FAD-dependent oxidoreductase [Nocardioidaceae bacterium]
MDEHYDLVVLGAGPAGEKAAALAAYHGRRVAVVERAARAGGAMVRDAATSKTMREAALYLTSFRARDVYGVGLGVPAELAVQGVRRRTEQVEQLLTGVVESNLERHGIDLVHGVARLAGAGIVEVTGPSGDSSSVSAGAIIIATGSRPLHPAGIPFDGTDVLDSETASLLDRPVRSLVVVGGGAVACEYASVFAALGTQVTLAESGPRLLRFMDAEIAGQLAEAYTEMGMRLVLGRGHVAVRRDTDGVRVELPDGETLRPEHVIVAAGRVGNTEDLGLSEAGVTVDRQGLVVVDAGFASTAAGIYAAGDVIGSPALASVSMEQGRVAACHALGIELGRSVDSHAPFGVYSVPETAMVGLTEEAARLEGTEVVVGRARLTHNARSVINGADRGLVKLLFRRGDRHLVGAHILGSDATELIHQPQAVMHFGGTVEYFLDATYNTPTVSEAFKFAAYDALSRLENRETLTASV